MPRIYHIATSADWEAARASGAYTTSTRGRTLAEEGFLHASRREQVDGVRRSFYADLREPLVLLTIDTARLTSPWREDPVGEETFPHIYGPLNPDAVVAVTPLGPQGPASFTRLFLGEMMVRILLAILAMLLAALGSWVGRRVGGDWSPFLGALLGLALGAGLLALVLRRRSRPPT